MLDPNRLFAKPTSKIKLPYCHFISVMPGMPGNLGYNFTNQKTTQKAQLLYMVLWPQRSKNQQAAPLKMAFKLRTKRQALPSWPKSDRPHVDARHGDLSRGCRGRSRACLRLRHRTRIFTRRLFRATPRSHAKMVGFYI